MTEDEDGGQVWPGLVAAIISVWRGSFAGRETGDTTAQTSVGNGQQILFNQEFKEILKREKSLLGKTSCYVSDYNNKYGEK